VVVALEVFGEGDDTGRQVVDLVDEDRHSGAGRGRRGPPAALAGEDLVSIAGRPDEEGLEDTEMADARDQLGVLGVVRTKAAGVEARRGEGAGGDTEKTARR
jgi:hypothetical protein